MNRLERLPKDIKRFISKFLDYDDKKSSYRLLEDKRPIRPCMELSEVKGFYSVVRDNLDCHPTLNAIKNYRRENWFVRIIKEIKYMSPSLLIRLVLLKKYLNLKDGRAHDSTGVWLQCPECMKYNNIELIERDGQFLLDIHCLEIKKQPSIAIYCDCVLDNIHSKISEGNKKMQIDHNCITTQYSIHHSITVTGGTTYSYRFGDPICDTVYDHLYSDN